MTPQVVTVPPGYLSRALLYRPVSVAEYRQMLADGVFQDGDPVELLEGYLVAKMAHNDAHRTGVQWLAEQLQVKKPADWSFFGQFPVTLTDGEPEPDGYLARGDKRVYVRRGPTAADVGLVVEVSDSTLGTDRRDKGRMYARAGIPVYWVVNVVDGQVEVYADPDPAADPPAYRTRTDYRPGQDVPVVLDGQTVAAIPVAELIP